MVAVPHGVTVYSESPKGKSVVDAQAMLSEIPKATQVGAYNAMRELMQVLVTDIKTNRLSKPRTGVGTVRVPGTKGATRQASGPPNYPQALSVLTGRGRQSITSQVAREMDGDVTGVVGSNLDYMRIHEMQNRGRAWLRPAVRDATDEILRIFDDKIEVSLHHLADTKKAPR